MRFLMLVIPDDSFEPSATIGAETEAWVDEGDRRGIRILGDRLLGASESTTVRDAGDGLVAKDGASASAGIAGFDVLEAENLDVVLDFLTRHPMVRGGTIEIRPFWED